MATNPGTAGFDLSSLASIVTLFAHIERELVAAQRLDDAMTALTRTSVLMLPGADAAGVTLGRKGKFQTVGAADEYVLCADERPYQLRSGPCVDAVLTDRIYRADDLRTDPRWPKFVPPQSRSGY